MSLPGRRATNQKETHHDPTIQEAITQYLRVQVSYCVLPEIPIPDIEGWDRGIGKADGVSILQTKGAGRSTGVEHTAWPCASGGVDSAKVCGIRIHGIPIREDGVAIVLAVWEPWGTILGALPVGKGILCEENWAGRRKDTEVYPVARELGKASWYCAR